MHGKFSNSQWLNGMIEEYRTSTHNVKKTDDQKYSLQSIKSNPQQCDVVFTVIKRLKEWIEFDFSQDGEQFKPLVMTVESPQSCDGEDIP